MEAAFSNKNNVLNTTILSQHDSSSMLYSLHTTYGFRGRKVTILRDENPPLQPLNRNSYPSMGMPRSASGGGVGGGGRLSLGSRGVSGSSSITKVGGDSGANALPREKGPIVGMIHWTEKYMEIHGQKRFFKDIKRKEGSFLNRYRCWKWGPNRKEYQLQYHKEVWKANLTTSNSAQGPSAASLTAPFRPHLFTKSSPVTLHITEASLVEDEIFLILVFIYSEAKRQDQNNSSVAAGSE